jgi:hypothetical protein
VLLARDERAGIQLRRCAVPPGRHASTLGRACAHFPAAMHLLLVEPVLISLSLYVMIIALENQRSTDFTIVLVLVEGFYIAYHCETYDATVITTITACSSSLRTQGTCCAREQAEHVCKVRN